MKKIINKNRRNIIDLCVIVVAILTLICNLIPTECLCFNNILCIVDIFYFLA